MQKVVTSAEMREMDRYTIEELGIPGMVLMENAGVGTFHVIQEIMGDAEFPLVYIFCGKGNNGGDGMVIARHLWDSGTDIRLLIAGQRSDLKGDALQNYNIIENLGIPVEFVSGFDHLLELFDEEPDLVVDALLGTGIKGAVEGFLAEVIEFINDLDCPVVSVDIPSGLNADSPEIKGATVKADFTVTMALPKRSHIFYPAREYVGELYIADIGIPHTVRNTEHVSVQIVEKRDIELPYRSGNSHKYNCGTVAVIAGSPGFTGAATLTAEASLRIGAGLVRLAVPQSLSPVLETKLTEVIKTPYPAGEADFLVPESLAALQELLDWCDVLAIGPGLGRSAETQQAIIRILTEFKKPAVIDADALFALARNQGVLKKPHPQWILTPHLGEFSRFLPDISKQDLQTNFLDIARESAQKFGINILLKGGPSLVADPDGEVFVNSTGNPGLSSGGTGDVLTGFVAGLLAQKLEPAEAAFTANFLHGFVADKVVEEESIYSLIAGDLITHLGPVLHQHFSGHHH